MRQTHPGSGRNRSKISAQRPVSCYFCRVRKLRCSRDFPCTNCETRGISCQLNPPSRSAATRRDSSPLLEAVAQESPESFESQILGRLQRLEEIVLSRDQSRSQSVRHTFEKPDEPPHLATPAHLQPHLSGRLQHLATDAAWLESLCAGQGSSEIVLADRIVFRISPIQQIPNSPTYIQTHSSGESTRCLWLPQFNETKIVLEKYINDISFIHPVIHIPSLRKTVDEIYNDLTRQTQIKPDHVALLFSIIASATYSWTQRDCERNLFSTPSEANSQTISWIKATHDLLDYSRRTTRGSLEGLQAMIIVSFVVSNWEGISQKLQSSLSTAIMMGRELGLHRYDHPSDVAMTRRAKTDAVRDETGRRVWWYLVATDWLLSRYEGPLEGVYTCNPRHSTTRQPQNVNDEDIGGMDNVGQPSTKPTTMSYLLQRIRLAEMCRKITDRTPLALSNPPDVGYSEIMDIDAELNTFINELPPFFSVDGNRGMEFAELDSQRASEIIIQSYLMNSHIQSHRCKLHLPFLTRGSVDPAYAYSRQSCVEAARIIVRNELQLEKEAFPFVATRLKFAGVLYGVFLASTILLLDMCLAKAAGQGQQEIRTTEVIEACRILELARDQSTPAARLVESLLQVLHRNKVSSPMNRLWQDSESESQVELPSVTRADLDLTSTRPGLAMNSTANNSTGDTGQEDLMNNLGPLAYLDDISQIFDQPTDFDPADWNTLFSGMDSSFI